jgi:RHS repeat-associated protein
VLWDCRPNPPGDGTDAPYSPALYVGSDGKLRGEMRDDAITPITSAGSVADGKWHFALLVAGYNDNHQTLYLDGKVVDTRSNNDGACLANDPQFVGKGDITADWPAAPTNNPGGYFNGLIANVTRYLTVPTDDMQQAMFNAAHTASTSIVPVTTVTVTDPGNATLQYSYDPGNGGRLITRTDGLGKTTSYSYDTNGFVYRVSDPDAAYVTTTRDSRGNVLSRDTGFGGTDDTSYYTYPPAGTYAVSDPRNDRPLTYLNADSAGPDDTTYRTTYTYSAAGSPLTTTTPLGRVTTNTYTAGTEAAVGGGNEPPGLIATQKDPMGEVTTLSYDSAGDLAQVVTPLGSRTTYAYDTVGRRISKTEFSDTYPDGLTTTYAYDGQNRLLQQTDPATTDAVTGKVHTPRTVNTYDVDGDLLSSTVSDTTGGDQSRTRMMTYNGRDQLTSVVDPANRTVGYGYDVYGNETSMTDAAGNSYAYGYDANRHQLSTTLHGWVNDPTNPSPPTDLVVDSKAYDPAGLLASDTDAMGRTVTYHYDEADRLYAKDLVNFHTPSGNTVDANLATYLRDAAGNINFTSTLDDLNTDYKLDADGRVTGEDEDDVGYPREAGIDRKTTFSYDADNNLLSTVVANGSVNEQTDYTYDAGGDRLTQTVHNGSDLLETSWTYDQRGLPTSQTDPRGNVAGAAPGAYTTTFANDARGTVVSVAQPTVNVETGGAAAVATHPLSQFGYDTFGELTASSDADGNITSYTYDGDGEQVAKSGAAYTPPGATAAITPTEVRGYDALGRLKSVTDPDQNTTTNTYDQLGRLSQSTQPTVDGGTPTWHYTYDADGERLSVTDPTGAQNQATYDDLGQTLTSTQVERRPTAAAYTTSYQYYYGSFPLNHPAEVTTPDGQSTEYSFNRYGQLLFSSDATGDNTAYTYDVDLHLTGITLPDSTSVAVSYDAAGRSTSVSQLDSTGKTLATRSATYDPAGNLQTTTDEAGATTRYSYDAANNVTQRVEPVSASASVTTSYGYDAAGQVTRHTDGDGNATTVTYNSLGMPESTVAPHVAGYTTAADSTTTLSYDGDRHVTAASLPGGVRRGMTYDALGRMTSETGSGAQASTATRSLGYDLDGRVTSVSTSSNDDTYTYNDRGEILTAAGPGGSSTFGYNGNGQLVSRGDKAGTATFTYDDDGRVRTAQDPQTGTTATYTYDTLGEVTGIGYGTGAVAEANTYNEQHQLTSQTLNGPNGTTEASVSYGYDADGHINSQTTTGTAGAASTTYGYDQAGRLTSASVAGGATTTYGYDGAGNRVQAGGSTATFNARNQLVSLGSTSYSYTARGTLSSQTSGANTTNYSYDAFDQLSSDGTNAYTYDGLGRLASAGSNTFGYDDTSSIIAGDGVNTYSRGPDGSLSSVSAAGHSALAFTNSHGDLSATFTATGNTLDGSTAFDAYGQTKAAAGNHYGLGYQGGWTSPATGYVATASRWYSPTQGGFTSQDSRQAINGPAVTQNYYAYGDDDPLDNADPSGNSSCRTSRPAAGKASAGARRTAPGRATAPDDSVNEAEDYGFEGTASMPSYGWGYAPLQDGVDEEGNLWENGQLVMPWSEFQEWMGELFGGEEDFDFAFASAGECVAKPSGPTAEQGINEKPINPRPEGQSAPANELGTKDGNSGPGDAPVNLDTQAEANPDELAGEGPFKGGSQPTAESSELDPEDPGSGAEPPDDESRSPLEKYRDSLHSIRTPDGSPANQYEIDKTGPLNYRLVGGGTQVDADGIDTATGEALEAKYTGNPDKSPFVLDSKAADFIKQSIAKGQEDEFMRYGKVLEDPAVPLDGLRVIVNKPELVPYFQDLIDRYITPLGVPGKIVVEN